jgi:hypothetical protein
MKILCIILSLLSVVFSAPVLDDYRPENSAFQYQSSFTPPFGGTNVPFWETGGNAMVMESFVRLTQNQKSQRGSIWSTRPLRARDWEILLRFSIGSDSRGADGMAFWYTKERQQPGPVMGNIDMWTGLGIIIDTFDNDGQRDNPQIYGVYNTRTFKFLPSTDGKENTLGICTASIRQSIKNPENKFVKLLMKFQDKTLTVSYDNSEITGATPGWINCFTATVPLEDPQTGYYLGVTAETGGLSDFHDVKSISTWSLKKTTQRNEKPNQQPPQQPNQPPQQPDTKTVPVSKGVENDNVVSKRSLSGNTASDIVFRLSELEKKDESFATALDAKFKEMQQKLESMEREQIQTLTRIFNTIDSIRTAVDVSQLIELKSDVKSALQSLTAVKERVDNIGTQVEGANARSPDLNTQAEKSIELRQLVERSSSWGFWTYLIIFQILFWGAFIWWRSSQEDKSKKIL